MSHPGHSEGRKVVLACGWGRLWRGLVNAMFRGWTGVAAQRWGAGRVGSSRPVLEGKTSRVCVTFSYF